MKSDRYRRTSSTIPTAVTAYTVIAGLAIVALVIPRHVASNESRPAVVKIVKTAAGYRLTRDGAPYFIKGGGGDGSLDELKRAGGNSVRTWGVENAGKVLDEAHKRGLTVTIGIWLGHERHGFSYNNADQVFEQYDKARKAIERFKNHPALLMWGIGNEMEGYEKGDNAAIWSAINNIASLAKKLDPNHPTMTVLAEIGGDKVKNVHRLCPDIDIVGINSYGGAATLADRYAKAGGTKPFVVTEFGPAGQWESPKTAWSAAFEPTSDQKAEAYRKIYKGTIAAKPLCLGSYAFIWGHKQEATATWFGLFLPDGSSTPGIDALSELWTGSPRGNRCPSVSAIKLEGADKVAPGAIVKALIKASDPEGDPLRIEWVVQKEASSYGSGGDAEAAPPVIRDAIVKSEGASAELRAPRGGGGYRLFAYVHDNHKNANVVNIPFYVEAAIEKPAARRGTIPLRVYAEAGDAPTYVPTGWMGNVKAIALEPSCATDPHSGKTCFQIDYKDTKDWGGVVWQSPPNDWGDLPGGFDLTGAERLVFWARGDRGGEVVSFELGLLGADKKFPDSASAKLDKATLSKEWKRFEIELTGKDLSRIKTGFCFVVAAQGAPIRFYLDDVTFE